MRLKPLLQKAGLIAGILLVVAGLIAGIGVRPADAAAVDTEGYATNFAGNLQTVRRVVASNGTIVEDERGPLLSGLLKEQLDRAWREGIEATCARIRERVAQKVAEKVRPTRLVNCDLVEGGELRARMEGTNLDLKYVTRGNVVTFWVTTPDICVDLLVDEVCVGAPRELDPKFTITFETELRIRIPVEGAPRPLRAVEATALVRNAYMDSNNVTGDIVGGVDALIQAFGGTGFFRDAEEEFNAERDNKLDDVNASLDDFDAPLEDATKAGFRRMRALLEGGTVVIELSRSPLADVFTPGDTATVSALAPELAVRVDGFSTVSGLSAERFLVIVSNSGRTGSDSVEFVVAFDGTRLLAYDVLEAAPGFSCEREQEGYRCTGTLDGRTGPRHEASFVVRGWGAALGASTVTATVDPNNRVAETDEANNTSRFTTTVVDPASAPARCTPNATSLGRRCTNG
jgi:hypothetical protein